MNLSTTSAKRYRSVNWDDEEKDLFRRIIKDYIYILRDNCLTSEANRRKTRAWEEIHKKFNELNRRERDINQLKLRWKGMKLLAKHANFDFMNFMRQDTNVMTPEEAVLRSPGEFIEQVAGTSAMETVFLEENFQEHHVNNNSTQTLYSSGVMSQPPLTASERNTTHIDTGLNRPPYADIIPGDLPKTTGLNRPPNADIIPGDLPKTTDDDHEFVNSLLNHVKILKNKEHRRRMEIAEEEHKINTKILEEKLKCAKLEREILELKKARAELYGE